MNDGLTPVRSRSPALWLAEPSPALALRSPRRMCQSAVVTHKHTIWAWRADNLKTFWICAHVSSMFSMNGKCLCLELVIMKWWRFLSTTKNWAVHFPFIISVTRVGLGFGRGLVACITILSTWNYVCNKDTVI